MSRDVRFDEGSEVEPTRVYIDVDLRAQGDGSDEELDVEVEEESIKNGELEENESADSDDLGCVRDVENKENVTNKLRDANGRLDEAISEFPPARGKSQKSNDDNAKTKQRVANPTSDSSSTTQKTPGRTSGAKKSDQNSSNFTIPAPYPRPVPPSDVRRSMRARRPPVKDDDERYQKSSYTKKRSTVAVETEEENQGREGSFRDGSSKDSDGPNHESALTTS